MACAQAHKEAPAPQLGGSGGLGGEALDAGLQALLTALALWDLLAAPTPG